MAKKEEQDEQQASYAGLRKEELHAVIASADTDELNAIWTDLERVGYSAEGITRKLIENRAAELAGDEPPHRIPRRSDLPPITGRLNV